jgi:hypothetical protein
MALPPPIELPPDIELPPAIELPPMALVAPVLLVTGAVALVSVDVAAAELSAVFRLQAEALAAAITANEIRAKVFRWDMDLSLPLPAPNGNLQAIVPKT